MVAWVRRVRTASGATAVQIEVFADHFGRRQVELGDCVRPYGSGCTHEHACIRCDFLALHPDARQRLDQIEDDLHKRIDTAQQHNWLADVEQLRITLRRLREKRSQLPPDETSTLCGSLNALPAWDVPRGKIAQPSASPTRRPTSSGQQAPLRAQRDPALGKLRGHAPRRPRTCPIPLLPPQCLAPASAGTDVRSGQRRHSAARVFIQFASAGAVGRLRSPHEHPKALHTAARLSRLHSCRSVGSFPSLGIHLRHGRQRDRR